MATDMITNITTWRAALTALDPAGGTSGYADDVRQRVVAGILAGPSPAATPTSRRPGRRTPTLAAAACLAALAVAAAGVALRPGDALAGEIDRLAVTAAGPIPSSQYLFTRTRTVRIGGSAQRPPTARRWDTDTTLAWQGDTCDDRRDSTLEPARFLSRADEQEFRADASAQDLQTVRYGYSTTVRGEDLLGLDSVPCDRMGRFAAPNPRYAATLPTDPQAFLAKAVRDSAGLHSPTPLYTPADAVLDLLGLPYLSAAQRAAALRAFVLAAGEWTAAGHATVAGVPGIVVRRDLGGVEQEEVISARAPGVLRSIDRISDPDRAPDIDPRYVGLPIGTEVVHVELLQVAVVPDLESTPQP